VEKILNRLRDFYRVNPDLADSRIDACDDRVVVVLQCDRETSTTRLAES